MPTPPAATARPAQAHLNGVSRHALNSLKASTPAKSSTAEAIRPSKSKSCLAMAAWAARPFLRAPAPAHTKPLSCATGRQARYSGKGVLKAVENVNEEIAPAIVGRGSAQPDLVDAILLELDGTENKAKFGANAILGVSLANRPRRRRFGRLAALPLPRRRQRQGLPVPMMNVLNGGKHADNIVDFQEFMIMPVGAPIAFARRCAWARRCFHSLKKVLHDRAPEYGRGR